MFAIFACGTFYPAPAVVCEEVGLQQTEKTAPQMEVSVPTQIIVYRVF